MPITSKQKKSVLLLAVLIISTALYVLLLGSLTAILMVPFMAVSFAMLGYYHADQVSSVVSAWMNRDGWK